MEIEIDMDKLKAFGLSYAEYAIMERVYYISLEEPWLKMNAKNICNGINIKQKTGQRLINKLIELGFLGGVRGVCLQVCSEWLNFGAPSVLHPPKPISHSENDFTFTTTTHAKYVQANR